MLIVLKTPLENYHSGIDDCRSISHVLKELLKRGAKFTTPQLVEEREPGNISSIFIFMELIKNIKFGMTSIHLHSK
jgi:hypothetical protein